MQKVETRGCTQKYDDTITYDYIRKNWGYRMHPVDFSSVPIICGIFSNSIYLIMECYYTQCYKFMMKCFCFYQITHIYSNADFSWFAVNDANEPKRHRLKDIHVSKVWYRADSTNCLSELYEWFNKSSFKFFA